MIIEIRYKAMHWDNHQGGSGRPFDGRLLRQLGTEFLFSDLYGFALKEIDKERLHNLTVIGDYRLISIVIDYN